MWPEIIGSIKNAGITDLEIYRLGFRLFMIKEMNDEFSFEKKQQLDDPKVEEWEALMWKYQQGLPSAKPGEKWMLMDMIFKLRD